MDIPELSAEEVARKSMTVAAGMCVFTNDNFLIEAIEEDGLVDAKTKK